MSDESKLIVRLEAQTAQLTKAMAGASATVKQRMREIDDQLVKSNRKVSDGLVRSARSYSEGARGMGPLGRSVQNTSYQIGDFAVQVAGGTSASRAMAQQLPQLLGGFGVFGAVAGAAAAILVPLAANMFSAVDPAEALTKSVSALSEAMGKLKSAQSSEAAPTTDLVDNYGRYAAQAKEVLIIQRQIAEIEAQRALAVTTGGFADVFNVGSAAEMIPPEIEGIIKELQKGGEGVTAQGVEKIADALGISLDRAQLLGESILVVDNSVAKVGETFGVTNAQAAGLVELMQNLKNAEGPIDQAAAMAALREAIIAATLTTSGLTKEGAAFLAQLSEAEIAALSLSQIDIASNVGAGADEASRLAGNLQIAAQAWLQARSVAQQPQNLALDKYGSRGAESSNPVADTFGAPVVLAQPVSAGRSGGSGGGGGGGGGSAKEPLFSANDKKIQQIQREIAMLGQSAQAVAALQSKWELLDRAKKDGADLDVVQAGTGRTLRAEIDLQSEAVGRLTAEMAAQKINRDAFEKGIDGVASAMSQALLNGESLRAGLAEVFKGIAMDLMKSGIRQGLMGLVGGLGSGGGLGGGAKRGGGLGGLLSGLLGGMPSFDGGGSTGTGARSGGVDGKGGFPAILHPGEEVWDRTKSGFAGAGGGAQRVEVEVFVRNDEIGAIAREAGMRGGQMAANAVRSEIPSIMDNHQKRRG